MAYQKQKWQNGGGIPLSADSLNHIEEGLENATTFLVVSKSQSYDIAANSGIEITIALDVPSGYKIISLLGCRTGSSNICYSNFVIEENNTFIGYLRNVTGTAYTARYAFVKVLCVKE